jgi:ribosomal protein L24E
MLNLKNQKLDKGTGYLYVYEPKHEMANKSGKVYVHRYVAQYGFNIKLTPDLIVHHKDEDKLNNDLSNLEVMTYEEHGKHHHGKSHVECICKNCGNIKITRPSEILIFCSHRCSTEIKKKFDIEKDELQNLVLNYPVTEIAKMLGVSDNAIHKRCKSLGIQKMPRGFFLKNR